MFDKSFAKWWLSRVVPFREVPADKLSAEREAVVDAATITPPPGRREQPLPIRISHWFNVLFLILMAGSGLQILAA